MVGPVMLAIDRFRSHWLSMCIIRAEAEPDLAVDAGSPLLVSINEPGGLDSVEIRGQ